MGFSVKLILGSRALVVSHFLLVYTKGREYSKLAVAGDDDDEQLDKEEAPHNDIYNSNVFPQEGTSRLWSLSHKLQK